MDSDRPNRTSLTTTNTSNELFICFTSRLSSSSMKLSSKSILSPGRVRDPPNSLSTSLSRRLRTNGSIKGGASPMFPTGGKKRCSAFENPEPSSPKVTCIGQVRVKTKKQGKKMRTLSRKQGGEVSFRKLEQGNQNHALAYQGMNVSNQNQYQQQPPECLPQRNQRWVHLPLTICEALRTFGAEFSCLFPCRPSCFSTAEREKEEKASADGDGQSSCGAVFARWLVAVQEGEGGKERDIELVVGRDGDEDDERRDLNERPVRNSRRHIFDELEMNEEICEVKNEDMGKEEEARVSISVPPKNALLLMRCRSDPNKMAALANRFWESPVGEDEEQDDGDKEVEYEDKDEQEQAEEEEGEDKYYLQMEDKVDEVPEKVDLVHVNEEQQSPEAKSNLYVEVQDNNEEDPQEDLDMNEELLLLFEETEPEMPDETEVEQKIDLEWENALSDSLFNACEDQQIEENGKDNPIQDNEEENKASSCSSSPSVNSDGETEEESLVEIEKSALHLETEESTREKGTEEGEEEETVTQERSDPDDEVTDEEEEGSQAEEERERETEEEVERESVGVNQQDRESTLLPDCLLMMMCEPKLSMEVSKETWVCSTDFIRRQPKKVVKPIDGGDDESKKRVSIDSDSNPGPAVQPINPQPLHQPRGSSCSLPAPAHAISGVSMATMIEQKLVNAVGYEPFVLTRCKSAPMKTASKLALDTCFWKNRNLEPHRRSNFGVGAAGVGF